MSDMVGSANVPRGGRSLKIWYVAAQRLCNFNCPYCVSVGTWAKSRKHNWRELDDHARFTAIVRWMGTRAFDVSVRLGSLGEPFASSEFLEQAGWLTRQSNVNFVELTSNGSLLIRRLAKMESYANLGKLSLWLTYHDGQIDLQTFISNAAFAQEEYGCFVVVNALFFPHNTDAVRQIGDAAREAGLRFNLDLGYNPEAPSDAFDHSSDPSLAAPVLGTADFVQKIDSIGGDPALTNVALVGLTSTLGRSCRAGHDYIFIDINGAVHRCSRYAVLEKGGHGNVLDPNFDLELRPTEWAPCEAANGCCNKEDFLNLDVARGLRRDDVPSLGWIDG